MIIKYHKQMEPWNDIWETRNYNLEDLHDDKMKLSNDLNLYGEEQDQDGSALWPAMQKTDNLINKEVGLVGRAFANDCRDRDSIAGWVTLKTQKYGTWWHLA